jgi:hypothetical protein
MTRHLPGRLQHDGSSARHPFASARAVPNVTRQLPARSIDIVTTRLADGRDNTSLGEYPRKFLNCSRTRSR